MQVPAPFEYERASSVDEAIALLERHGEEARLIAGGAQLVAADEAAARFA
jgi:aerobic carbon-monoxide dehydrogenase medium subunit